MHSPLAALATLAVISIITPSGAANANDEATARNAGMESVDLPLPANWQWKEMSGLLTLSRV